MKALVGSALLGLVIMAGCDSNPGGPSVTDGPSAKSGEGTAPPPATDTKAATRRGAQAPTPASPE